MDTNLTKYFEFQTRRRFSPISNKSLHKINSFLDIERWMLGIGFWDLGVRFWNLDFEVLVELELMTTYYLPPNASTTKRNSP
ncbi:hypothetical protein [Hyunsoonleella pacifica]|uniref:Uncharacterized protein n=1 Tax=Hyunsoonleella pacifica TaxID=1080224 RepID=A0A4V2JB57_9FLAO|nr:hypothetical protein [Hyunsoonleella pacifica]TBN17388.1 hypothetical protein EYD46_03465 [Hyunsoonleella pacifica]GGD12382.1 hypothetical protein GCM10011368_12990 [Hyunsoonleella pacifica]